jgi:1,4-dihydroxy-2-naphthoate octaprenyltransferase
MPKKISLDSSCGKLSINEILKEAPPNGWRIGWLAIRPRTLSIAATPVLVGTAVAVAEGAALVWLTMLAALCCALLIQVGTNLHNDSADYENGTDHPGRLGPLRVTAAGWASAGCMRRAATTSFALAFLLGIYLVALGGWPILIAGMASLLAGWSYSGGRHPISHTPLGEVFVVVFFGLIAVAGSHWLQREVFSANAWLAGLIVGLPAAAVLLINNYRDMEGDLSSGRRTLVSKLGRKRSRWLYAVLMLLPFVVLPLLFLNGLKGVLLGFLVLPVNLLLIRSVFHNPPGEALNELLARTAQAGCVLGLVLSIGVLL